MRISDTVYNYISDCEEFDINNNFDSRYDREEIKLAMISHIKTCKRCEIHAYSYYTNDSVSSVVLECVGCGEVIEKHC